MKNILKAFLRLELFYLNCLNSKLQDKNLILNKIPVNKYLKKNLLKALSNSFTLFVQKVNKTKIIKNLF